MSTVFGVRDGDDIYHLVPGIPVNAKLIITNCGLAGLSWRYRHALGWDGEELCWKNWGKWDSHFEMVRWLGSAGIPVCLKCEKN